MNRLQATIENGLRAISPREANERKASVLFLDVRTPAEFGEAHIEGAVLHPLGGLNPVQVEKLTAGKEACVVICQSGKRAESAAAKLKGCDVPGLCVLDGGLEAWIAAGLPVNRGESRGLSLMRQVQLTIGLVSATGAGLALFVNPLFAIIPLVTGCGLLFAGITGFCGLAVLLAKMPWNRAGGCPTGACCETGK